MKLKDLLERVPENLGKEARIILAHLLKIKPAEVLLKEESEVSSDLEREFHRLIEKRKKGIPTAYIIGEWDFMGRSFAVREGILIPRPETELLVEKVLTLINPDSYMKGLEIGTGTGAISISLLAERNHLLMTATDTNPEAIRLAEKNALHHGVASRLKLLRGEDFKPAGDKVFDFIVSNPPYIPERFWKHLPTEVKMEGYNSLIGGEKGYEFYERISSQLIKHLKKGGFVAFEIGHDQGRIVEELLLRAGLTEVKIYKDYAGQDRIAIGWNY